MRRFARCNRIGTRVLFVVLGLCAARAQADEPVKHWFEGIAVNAFASVGYEWNFNDPPNNQNLLRAFDTVSNSIFIDAAEVVVQHAVVNPNDIGFRIDLAFGQVARVAAARGLFRDPVTGQAGDIDLQQAFGSYIVPVGKGLRIDAGKFVTPVGTEFIDGYDGYNDNFSRSLLFTWAIPFTHTGLRLSYAFNDKFSAMVMLVNGWDNVLDNNQAKSFGVSLAITPIPALQIFLNYIGGPERDNNDSDFRHLVDVGLVWKALSRLTLTLNADWGLDANAILDTPPPMPLPMAMTTPMASMTAPMGPAHDAQWAGIALYARVQATNRFALIGRGEVFWDFDGFRTGTAQRVIEGTFTPELKISDAFLVRGEFRIDVSDQAIFPLPNALFRKYQPTIGLNCVYVF